MLSVIIPAYNEESVIEACLRSVLGQKGDVEYEIIVAANGCSDRTVEVAKRALSDGRHRVPYEILDIPVGNKNNALNAADRIAKFGSRLYLDADVVCSDNLLVQLDEALKAEEPVYATGTLVIRSRSFASHCYAKIWQATPYILHSTPGCGCYAVNHAGRRLWGEFPTIHSDDKFVRLLFPPGHRRRLAAAYFWPLPHRFVDLVTTRIRWIRGNRQLSLRYPELSVNDSPRLKMDLGFLRVVFGNPFSTCVFLAVYSIAAARAYLEPVRQTVFWSRSR